MANYQKPKDIFIQRKTTIGTFEEYPLIVEPNSVIVTDVNNNLYMVSLNSLVINSESSSWASSSISASYAPGSTSTTYTSSLYGTASWAINVVNNGNELISGSTYDITSSWANTASVLTDTFRNSILTSILGTDSIVLETITGSYNSAFFHCNIKSGSNMRSETILASFLDGVCTYTISPTQSIVGNEKPTLSSVIKNKNTSLTTWTSSILMGDYIGFYVSSSSTVTRIHINIFGVKS